MKWDANRKSKEIVKVKDLKGEIWKDVVGYEGVYQISNLARVKRVGYNIESPHCKYRRAYKDEMEIKQMISTNGYKKLSLCKDKIIKNQMVHRLLMIAFVPNPENKPFINHIDGNTLNNSLENLEWCTPKENVNHAINIGLINNKGINNKNTKITEDIAKEIKRLISLGHKKINISRELNVSAGIIYSIAYNKCWKYV